MSYYSPYGLQGMRGMRPQMYGMQGQQQAQQQLGGMYGQMMGRMPQRGAGQQQAQQLGGLYEEIAPAQGTTGEPIKDYRPQAPQPNYPMYGRNPYNTPGVRPLYGRDSGTTWQNFRGGRQGPPSMYGGLGSYGNMMGGYGGGGMYGGGMGGMYGGGGMPGYGDPRMLSRPSPERPPPGVPGFNPPGQYGSPLTNQFRYGLMGANPAAYSQSLRQMGYFQPQMPAQTDLQNLMGYQQASFNPYLAGTTTPDPNTTTGAATTGAATTGAATTGAATTGAATTGAATTTQGPYATTTQGPYATTTWEPWGPGGCPSPEEHIQLANNDWILAGELKVGDEVMTSKDSQKVTRVQRIENSPRCEVLFEDGDSIVTSYSHPYFVNSKGFVEVGDLKKGDILGDLVVKDKKPFSDGPVISLSVDKTETYMLQGGTKEKPVPVLSHNKTPVGPDVPQQQQYGLPRPQQYGGYGGGMPMMGGYGGGMPMMGGYGGYGGGLGSMYRNYPIY